MTPEYGARVELDERYDYPTSGGTIVGSVEILRSGKERICPDTLWTIRRDFDGQEANYTADLFTVTLAPSVSADQLTQRWGTDGALEAMEDITRIPRTTPGMEIYEAALIVEIYKVHAYGPDSDVIRYDRGGWISGPTGWDSV